MQRLLGHSVKSVTGSKVASRYDLSQALARKRQALDAWGDHLTRLTRGEPAPVVALHR